MKLKFVFVYIAVFILLCLMIVEKVEASTQHIYIQGLLEMSENIIQSMEILYNADKKDIVIVHIDTLGGSSWTMFELVHAMQISKAHIITECLRICLSAGGFIYMTGDETIQINSSKMLLHLGRINNKVIPHYDIRQFYSFPWIDKYISPRLTKKENLSLLCGEDLVYNGKEMKEIMTRPFQHTHTLSNLLNTEEGMLCILQVYRKWIKE